MLRAENLTLQRGTRILQQDLSFALAPGQALWVRGANGVGKSTLLETLCGFRPIYHGEMYWRDEAVSADMDRYHDAIAYLGHKNGNNPNLTTETALSFYADLYDSNQLDKAIEAMGLSQRRDVLVKELSAGQQKRLALARLLLRDAPLWILDEPSVSLDTDGVALLVSEMRRKIDEGGMVIFTSHVDLGLDAQIFQLEPMSVTQISQADEFLSGDWEGVA